MMTYATIETLYQITTICNEYFGGKWAFTPNFKTMQ